MCKKRKQQNFRKKKAVFSWSGGKDSALALQKILEDKNYEVIALMTTVQKDSKESSIHDIPYSLLKKQANSIGLPLYTIPLQKGFTSYKEAIKKTVLYFKKLGVTHFIYGDIFLEDVKKYRESLLNEMNIEVVQPLWGKTSGKVVKEFLQSGLKAKIIITQAEKLKKEYIGKALDNSFFKLLPKNIEICGEYGEYHSFVYDGPLFKYAIKNEIVGIELISHRFKMANGNFKSFYYWKGFLSE